MIKSTSYLRVLTGICLLLLLTSNCWCEDLSPSVVGIYQNQIYICAGTLVKDNFAVTLASCFKSVRNIAGLKVMGNLQINGVVLAPYGQSSVVKIFKPKYRRQYKNTGIMDVAVLKFKYSISELGIKPAKLCSQRKINYSGPLTLYYSDRISTHGTDILQLRTKILDLSKRSYKNSHRSYSVFFAENPELYVSEFFKGSPAVIAGEFCGICQYKPDNTDITLAAFTSLASWRVIKFIEESLEK